MRKKYKYENYEFLIEVKLNVKVERHIGGLRYHQVSIKNMGTDKFDTTAMSTTEFLETSVKNLEKAARDWVDFENGATSTEKVLIKLGFTK